MENQIFQDTTEGLKLSKNTKGYNWEIKLKELNIDKIEELNNEMIKRFGGSDGNTGDY